MRDKTIEDIFMEVVINPLKKGLPKIMEKHGINQQYVDSFFNNKKLKIGYKFTINYPKAKEYDPDEEERRKVRIAMKKAKKELKELNDIMTTTTNKKRNRL